MVTQAALGVNPSHNSKTSYRKTRTPLAKPRKVKAKTPAQRRYWLDIGKNISLALMAEKYDLDVVDAGGDGAQ